MIKKYIKRPQYLDKIKPFIDKEVIKVIVGQRRVGKSYLLFQVMDLIKKLHPTANIIYLNKESLEFEEVKNYQDLNHYAKERYQPRRKNYLFIDEIQEIESFEKALRSLLAHGRFDIYCTGSNARLLSGELATYLSGRYVEIFVYSLSYGEFLRFHRLTDSEETFLKYIKYGGLPYLKNLKLEDELVYGYLSNVYSTILLKDIVARFKIRQVDFLEKLVEYLLDNLGSLVSAKKISDFLKAQKINISPNVVLNYLKYLEQAFFVFRARRADVRGKKIFETNDKFYFNDLGLRHCLKRYYQADIGKVLENLVFLHLKFLGYKVSVGWIGGREIDFVAEAGGKKRYFQVAYLLTAENREREFGNLLRIKDNYPKIVVSADRLVKKEVSYQGIEHWNIREFLLGYE